MKYKNPHAEQEVSLLEEMVRSSSNGCVPPEGFFPKLEHVYGSPLELADPSDVLVNMKQVVVQYEEEDPVDVVVNNFQAVRQVVLRAFYPGKEGYDLVRHYWQEQRDKG
tara:strand:- start:1356 stop:1682 length:327 start_codon:yes stop_codon:yes gene_type:complete